MEKAKKKAKELHANAIVDFHLRRGTYSWQCTGTAVRVLKSVKKESCSEEGNNIKKEEDDKKTLAKTRKPVTACLVYLYSLVTAKPKK